MNKLQLYPALFPHFGLSWLSHKTLESITCNQLWLQFRSSATWAGLCWELHSLSLCCQGSGPAQLRAALVQPTAHCDWFLSLRLPRVTPRAACQHCPLPMAHPSLLAVWADAASSAHLQPAFPVQTAQKIIPSHPLNHHRSHYQPPGSCSMQCCPCCVAGRSPCPLQQRGPTAARCCSTRAAVSEGKPLQGPAAREQNRKKTPKQPTNPKYCLHNLSCCQHSLESTISV